MFSACQLWLLLKPMKVKLIVIVFIRYFLLILVSWITGFEFEDEGYKLVLYGITARKCEMVAGQC